MSVFRRGAHSRRRFCVSRDQRNNPNSYKRSAFSGLKTTDFSRGRGAHKRANDAAKVLSKKNYPAFIGAVFAALLLLVVALPQAYAAIGDATSRAVSEKVLANNTVQGVSPNGTTIDLFDYWTTDTEVPSEDDYYNYNGGINNGHQLKFNTGSAQNKSDVINSWTGSGNGPRTGIVASTLLNGYPSIKAGLIDGWVNYDPDGDGPQRAGVQGTQDLSEESLAYLFDNSAQEGKQGYYDVQGLLQVDSDGYYYYNASSEQTTDAGGSFESANYTTFDSDANSFTLYNTWAVMNEGTNSPDGQFFPFSDANNVFNSNHGQLTADTNVKASSNDLNHYFGMHMSTQFVQQFGGHTEENGDIVTYEFSGDDDVWIYIDDVLVADLGGIHDAARVTIDFSTGEIHVYDSTDQDVTPNRMNTLRECYETAQAGSTVEWSNNTFADNTYHTLDFFYLERGNNDSNMSLKYNLVNIPETDISKVDQEGNYIAGAEFAVHDTTDGKTTDDPNNLICNATTESDGTVTLLDDRGYPITLESLYKDGVRDITLVETVTPDGYRGVDEIPLYIQYYSEGETQNGKPAYLLLSKYPWITGAYAQSKVTTTAADEIQIDTKNGGTRTLTDEEKQNGAMFIVVEKQVDGRWCPVTGDALGGWEVYTSNDFASIAQAGQETNAIFTISRSGAYEAEVENLPGRIQEYQFFTGADGATYRGAYYYTSASTLAGADESNTYAISNSSEFDREFSARVYVSNILNRLLVQKTDESGAAVNGATMALFGASNVDVAADGTATLKEGVTVDNALQTATTHTLTEEADSVVLDGAAVFSNLEPGTYYVAEVSAPDGYAVNDTLAKVVVDDTGVYADAGEADDGVTVTRGVGRIVRSMIQFATDDDIDATLHNIVATPQLGTQNDDGTWNWMTNQDASVQHLQYDDDGNSVLDYALQAASQAYTVDEGAPRLSVGQCSEHLSEPRQDVSSYDLTNLFTGVTIVRIADEQVGGLDVTKQVSGEGADANAEFSFTVTFTHAATDGGDATPLTQDEVDASGMQLAVDTGDAGNVTVGDNGEVTFTLKGGETAYLTNVPAGVSYTVEETAASGFETSYDNFATGTIEFNKKASTTVTNTWHQSVVIGDDEAGLQATKEVTGAPALSEFEFELKLTSNNASNVQVVTGDTAEAFPTDGIKVSTNNLFNENSNTGIEGSETIDFGDLSFTAEGVYTFEVTETNTTDAGGWTYGSGSGSVITVTVTDEDQDGQLEATTVVEQDGEQVDTNNPTITNSYVPASVTATGETALQVTKEVAGAPALSDFDFTMTLTSGEMDNVKIGSGDNLTDFTDAGIKVSTSNLYDEGVQTGKEDKETVGFGDITFTAAGDYTFTVVEDTTTDAAGWNYRSGENYAKTITVHVTDENYNGQLYISVEGNNQIFTNSYAPESATLTGDTALKVQKTVTGAPTDVDFTFGATFDAEASAAAETPGSIAGIQGATEGQNFTLAATVSDNFAEGDAAKTASFGDVTFTQPGTYIFNVTETNEAPAEGSGWTYDGTVKTITVVVTDNSEGALVADVTYGNDVEGAAETDKAVTNAAAFTNSYEAAPVMIGEGDVAGINVQKTLTGRDWQEGDSFEFALKAQNGAPMPEDEDGDTVTITNASNPKSASFGSITYNTEGTYTYTVMESVPDDADKIGGVTYDAHTATVTVTVTDTNHDGKLEASVSYDNKDGLTEADQTTDSAAAFTNSYGIVPGTEEEVDTGASFGLTKQLTGTDWGERTFTFSITPTGETPAPVDSEGSEITQVTVSAPSDGDMADVDFGTIIYNATGIYTYTIKEVVPEGATGNVYNGITYDTHEVTVTVTITDDLNGDFNQSVSVSGEKNFVNNYHTELNYDVQGSLDVVKNLAGQAITADQFAFTVQPVSAADGTTTAQEAADKAGFESTDAMTFSWGAGAMADDGSGHSMVDILTKAIFTQEDAGKTYTYKFREVIPDSVPDYYTYDNTVYTVTITTDDDGNGNLTVTTTITGSDGSSTEYVFDSDAESESPAVIPFNNSYSGTGQLGGDAEASLNATKVTNGRDMTADEYNFTVTMSNGEGDSEQVTTGTNAAASDGVVGAVTFEPITYTTESLIEDVTNGYAAYGLNDEGHGTYTYSYTVAEVTEGLADEGITPSTSSFQVTVVVTDNNDGTYGVAVTYPDGSGDALAFANTYQTNEVPLTVSGKKAIDANGWSDAPDLADIAEQYTFTLSGVDENGNPAPLPGSAEGSVTANNDAAGNVSFGSITYTLDNVFGDTTAAEETTEGEAAVGITEDGTGDTPADESGIETYTGTSRTKTYTYTIEESGTVAGIQNDSAKTFTVTVTDDGSGKLTVSTDPGSAALFTFTNTYNVPEESSSPTDGSLTLNKVLTGRDMAEGEFSFVMTGTSENAQGMTATGTNTAAADCEAGSVALSAVTFQNPGTYEFQISEANGNLGGVDYDSATLKAVAEVSSDGKGKMEIDWTIYNADGTEISDYTYNNTYTADVTSVTLGASKALDGRVLADGEFSFELRDADGNVLQTKQNAANGAISFDPITYDVAGEYTYTIAEVAGSDSTITYDQTVYNVTVSVTDSGTGALQATTTITNSDTGETSQASFVNTYTEPPAGNGDEGDGGNTNGGSSDEGPLESLAQTSDTWLPALFAVIAAMAAAVGGFAAYRMKRSNGRR